MKIQKDKLLHLVAGIIISIILILLFESYFIGIIGAAIAGAAKEYWDSKGNGQVELLDFIATVAGGVVGVTIWNIISHLI